MFKELLNKLEPDELKELSKFFMDVAKGILGAPLVIYLVSGFSALVVILVIVVDLILVISCLLLAIYLSRKSKKGSKKHG